MKATKLSSLITFFDKEWNSQTPRSIELINIFQESINNAYIKTRQFNHLINEKILLFVGLKSSEFAGKNMFKLKPILEILNEKDIDVLEFHIDYFSFDCIEKQLNIVLTMKFAA